MSSAIGVSGPTADRGHRPSAAAPVGSLEWTRRYDGRLRARDRLRLLGQGVIFELSQAPWQALGPVGLRPRKRLSFDLDRVRIPDSGAAKEAERVCEQMRPQMLINHSYRTFLWANVFASTLSASFDEEALYVSSLLHDLGLSEEHRLAGPACFTLVGAEAAERAASGDGWSEERAQLAAEAITLHMNLRVPPESVEARLMTAGTTMDVVGASYWRVAPETIASVLERYPRGATKDGMLEAFKWQAGHNKGTRAQFYSRYLGLGLRVRFAPYAS